MAELLSDDGPFADSLDGFVERPGQQLFAELTLQALSERKELLVEMPSGMGKTLAYLTPILCSGGRVVISTASHNLQHQLFVRDIPFALRTLNRTRTVAILKGRRHYVCPYYLEKYLKSEVLQKKLVEPLQGLYRSYLKVIERKTDYSQTVDPSLQNYATSSIDDCLGQSCPRYSRCPLMLARSRAAKADVLVVNHHLLFSASKNTDEDVIGNQNLQLIVVDEVHKLINGSLSVVGRHIAGGQLRRVCSDIIAALVAEAPDMSPLKNYTQRLQAVIDSLAQRIKPNDAADEECRSVIGQLAAGFSQLNDALSSVAERGLQLREVSIRAGHLAASLKSLLNEHGRCWLDIEARNNIAFRYLPADMNQAMRRLIKQRDCGWLFTSATLEVNGSARPFMRLLGISEEQYIRIPSEFDYRQQACLYTPQLPVDIGSPEFYSCYAELVASLLAHLPGRVLMLFSSYRALRDVAQLLAAVSSHRLLIQGELDNQQLLGQFMAHQTTVLLGTGSFWEGLDLSGAAIQGVLVDKLPFAMPEADEVKLRAAYLQTHGVDPFEHYVLPEAILRLRQGIGRLLRRNSDQGVIMLADPRLDTRAYGRQFLDSLPAMARHYRLETLKPFLDCLPPNETVSPR